MEGTLGWKSLGWEGLWGGRDSRVEGSLGGKGRVSRVEGKGL